MTEYRTQELKVSKVKYIKEEGSDVFKRVIFLDCDLEKDSIEKPIIKQIKFKTRRN